MANMSLRRLAATLGSNSVSGMAQAESLNIRPISARALCSLIFAEYSTQHYDNGRTGWNPNEFKLTVANVPQLTQLFAKSVDGTIYAQPLYVAFLLMPSDNKRHNAVYVATESDTVYAFDADNGDSLWTRSLIPPGEQFVVVSDIEGCNNVAPNIGITSTPVIDSLNQIMYVVAKTKQVVGSNTTFHYRLYALDITSGADRLAPVEIAGSVPGTGDPNDGKGHVVFDPHIHLNRPGLLLLNGVVYVGFGSHCDEHLGSYHGWVFGYDAAGLTQVGVFATTPDTPAAATSAAGVWQGGMGLAADPQGFIYFTTGNGDFTANAPGGKDYGDTVVKLTSFFGVTDYFTPSYQPTLLDGDIDLGSGGVLIVPDPPPGNNLPSTLVAAGKDGNILLINRNNMGQYTPGGPDRLLQSPPLQMAPGSRITDATGIWGGPAYYANSGRQLLYYCGSGGHMKAYTFSGTALSLSMIGPNPNQSPQAFPSEGGTTPNISSNGQAAGTAVLWAITRSNPLRLQAFDATDLTKQLFDAAAGPWNNSSGGAFIEPTTIQGKVYVPSDGQLTVFGLPP